MSPAGGVRRRRRLGHCRADCPIACPRARYCHVPSGKRPKRTPRPLSANLCTYGVRGRLANPSKSMSASSNNSDVNPTVARATSSATSSPRTRRASEHGGRVATRFPPEPNGYLHIGHAKAICVDFGLAQEFGGTCNLRFDDTNPTTEDVEYVEAIQEDIRWLGFEWSKPVLRVGLLREAVPAGGEADREGQRLRRQPVRGRDPRVPRRLLQEGQAQPVPEPPDRREPGPVQAHARRGVPRGRARAARARSISRRRT